MLGVVGLRFLGNARDEGGSFLQCSLAARLGEGGNRCLGLGERCAFLSARGCSSCAASSSICTVWGMEININLS